MTTLPGPCVLPPTAANTSLRARPARGFCDQLGTVGAVAILRTLAVATGTAVLAAALWLSGAAAAAIGVADGTELGLGTYRVLPKGPQDLRATVVLAIIGGGLLIAAIAGWQRRVILGRVHQAEIWAVAAWAAAVAGSGELLLARPIAGGMAAALAAGYLIYVWVRTRPQIRGWNTRQALSSWLRRLWWRGPWRQPWNRMRRGLR